MLRNAFIIGSTRPGRNGEAVAQWAYDIAPKRGDADFELVTGLFRDWAAPLAGKAREVIYWHFGEVTKLNATVGVSEVEEQAAAKAKAAHP